MSFAGEVQVVRQRLLSQWTALHPTVAIAWDAFGGPVFTPDGNAWIRPTLRMAGAKWASIGGAQAKQRSEGFLIVQVFSPISSGDASQLALCDDICTIFRRYASGGITFRWAPYVETGGRDPELPEYDMDLVFCRYFRDENL